MPTFKVHDNFTEAVAHTLANRADKAALVVAIQAATDTAPYVPMLTGSLNVRTRVEGNMIVYPGPYARYLYYGKLMIDPKTGSAWARKGVSKVVTDRNLIFTTASHGQAQSHWFEASKAQNLDKWLEVAEKAVTKDG